MDFAKVAPYLKEPLVLTGFFLFLSFSFARGIIKAGIIPRLTANLGYRVLQQILLYGFIIALALIALGFGLKYRELSRNEQANAVRLLNQELAGNLKVLEELRANTETIVRSAATISTIIRTPGIKILPIIFPLSNTDTKIEVAASSQMARDALQALQDSGLWNDELERQKFLQAASAIAGTVQRTLPTVTSLADASNQRYVVTSDVWQSQLPVLRKVDVIDVTLFQRAYQNLFLARANYNVVVARSIDYLAGAQAFFKPSDGQFNRQNLAAVLASERNFLSLTATFLPNLLEEIAALREIEKSVARLE